MSIFSAISNLGKDIVNRSINAGLTLTSALTGGKIGGNTQAVVPKPIVTLPKVVTSTIEKVAAIPYIAYKIPLAVATAGYVGGTAAGKAIVSSVLSVGKTVGSTITSKAGSVIGSSALAVGAFTLASNKLPSKQLVQDVVAIRTSPIAATIGIVTKEVERQKDLFLDPNTPLKDKLLTAGADAVGLGAAVGAGALVVDAITPDKINTEPKKQEYDAKAFEEAVNEQLKKEAEIDKKAEDAIAKALARQTIPTPLTPSPVVTPIPTGTSTLPIPATTTTKKKTTTTKKKPKKKPKKKAKKKAKKKPKKKPKKKTKKYKKKRKK